MEFILELIPTSWEDRRKILILGVVLQAVLVVGFSVSAFVVAETANSGFNVVLTALVTIGFIGGFFQIIRQSTSPIAIGYLVGASGTLSTLSLLTGIYWSHLAHCEHLHDFVANQYSCNNTAAYKSVSVFVIMLSGMQAASAVLVYAWRAELIDESGRYDEITSDMPTFNPYQTASASPKAFGGEIYGRIEERSADL